MSVAGTSRTGIVNRVSRWSQPGHDDARPDRYRPSPNRHALAPTVNTAIKSP
jgi:hypothetical protein